MYHPMMLIGDETRSYPSYRNIAGWCSNDIGVIR